MKTHYPHEAFLNTDPEELIKYYFWAILLSPTAGALRIKRFWEYSGMDYTDLPSPKGSSILYTYTDREKAIIAEHEQVQDVAFLATVDKLVKQKEEECIRLLREFKERRATYGDHEAVINMYTGCEEDMNDVIKTWKKIISP